MDHYELLGVRRGASTAEIKRAYQKLARQLHPDLNPGDPIAADRFQWVSRAFEVLSDPQRRSQYDRGEPAPAPPRPPDVGFQGFDFSAEVRVGSLDFREFIDGVLRPSPTADSETRRGEDLEQVAEVSFDEAFHGAVRRAHLMRLDPCSGCAGSGELPFNPRPCPSCGGSGQVRASRGRMIFTRRCGECAGAGTVGRRSCGRCAGEGRLMQSEWIEVHIPAGVADGARLLVPGAGNAGRRGGPPGDFALVVRVAPHPFYRREGEDLHCQVPITITEAALGAHIEVPTPDSSMTIEIPAGTQTGQRFRLRKRGFPRLGEKGRGDLFVEAQVWVPPAGDDESRRLLAEFARRNPHDPRAERDLSRFAGAKE
ncbi:MAG TPA: J domain-containing protein [Vicinamibacteria bacterium]|nr:J domain-containing protein [Vicinamibacteria bacterium]